MFAHCGAEEGRGLRADAGRRFALQTGQLGRARHFGAAWRWNLSSNKYDECHCRDSLDLRSSFRFPC
jgi:hypothetical protein